MISIIGASLKKIRDDAHQAALSPDGSRILYLDVDTRAIWVMNADGSQAHLVVKPDKGFRVFGPTWFANGKRFFYVNLGLSPDKPRVVLESRDFNGGPAVPVLDDIRALAASLDEPGRVIYSLIEPAPRQYDSNLYELRYDPESGKRIGDPRQLTNWTGFNFTGLSTTRDGQQFIFLNSKFESPIFVGELANGNDELKNPQRLTLNESLNAVGDWTSDSKSIVFASNRDSNFNIYSQGVADRSARSVVSGQDEELGPVVSPDGKWALYIQWPNVSGTQFTVKSGKLMRAPISGGAPEFVMDVEGSLTLDSGSQTPQLSYPQIRCPHQSGDCVISEVRDGQAVFSTFDPMQGRKKQVGKAEGDPDFVSWALSPDGSRIVTTLYDYKIAPVTIIPVDGSAPQKFKVNNTTQLCAAAWAADGKSLFLASYSSRGTAILHADLSGNAKVLYKPSWDIYQILPSPDGKYLAFVPTITNANAWKLNLPTK
jgi:Tol biopolymer transport system component